MELPWPSWPQLLVAFDSTSGTGDEPSLPLLHDLRRLTWRLCNGPPGATGAGWNFWVTRGLRSRHWPQGLHGLHGSETAAINGKACEHHRVMRRLRLLRRRGASGGCPWCGTPHWTMRSSRRVGDRLVYPEINEEVGFMIISFRKYDRISTCRAFGVVTQLDVFELCRTHKPPRAWPCPRFPWPRWCHGHRVLSSFPACVGPCASDLKNGTTGDTAHQHWGRHFVDFHSHDLCLNLPLWRACAVINHALQHDLSLQYDSGPEQVEDRGGSRFFWSCWENSVASGKVQVDQTIKLFFVQVYTPTATCQVLQIPRLKHPLQDFIPALDYHSTPWAPWPGSVPINRWNIPKPFRYAWGSIQIAQIHSLKPDGTLRSLALNRWWRKKLMFAKDDWCCVAESMSWNKKG